MTVDLAALRQLAEKATPGPWQHCSGHWVYADRLFIAMVDDSERGAHEGAFIAAANPATILALLAELESDRRELEAARRVVLM